MAIVEEIIKAMESSEHTRYRIAQNTGIAESQLSRFASGKRGMSVDALETLAEYLGFEIVLKRKRQRRKK